ncbi:Hemolysin, chromosomal [Roseivivax jejudonensis]|uniref:Hemolysin, chromosomal n=1 Tax=Roseivivax jejudonensis TaxID=1529041 RepID=A0A1X6YV45_9RHOB|nr:malectin domain-containing carbohydrate-binding protein [Roseivivax jejudonensis]SLN32397.1 Hemolysin, chromosomal [Roseivivax jejudonensis]
MVDVSFNQSTLNGYDGFASALQWHSDGRLYVAERTGSVKVLDVEKTDSGDFDVTSTDQIDLINNIVNHNDDGTEASDVGGRQVTGLVVGDTAEDPVIYVSSSDPRIGAGGGGEDKGLDTNSGVISRLTYNDATGSWDKVDIVRGLPRSEENHSTNGLELSDDGSTLYVAQGGHTNAGAPSNNFAGLPEYAYSGAILSVDLDQIDQIEQSEGVKDADGANPFVYDLPTLNDPSRPDDGTAGNENPDGTDVDGPWGGNDGFNMAKLTEDSPVQVFSPGYRNAYDILQTEDGHLYTYDNGANNGWGGQAVDESGAHVDDPSQTATTLPHEDDDYDPQNYDNLHRVTEGSYGGHPNAIRAAGEDAGLLVTPEQGVNDSEWLEAGDGDLPEDFADVVPTTNPEEGVYQEGGYEDTALDTGSGSVNGLAEYTASTTWDDGNGVQESIQGALLATDYNGDIYVIPRDEDGVVQTTTGGNGQTVAEGKQVIDLNAGGGPLGIDAQGDGEAFAGSVWVANLNNSEINILEPGEGSGVSTDRDNDGLDNTADRFALDPENGTGAANTLSGGEGLFLPFESGTMPNTYGGSGFTGAMTNGEDAFIDGGLYDADNIIAGGAGGVFTIKSVTPGDAYQDTNKNKAAMQTGVTLDDSVGTADITLSMTNWIPDATSEGGFPSAGLQIGAGNQDDYLKLVLGGRGNDGGDFESAIFETVIESDGAATSTQVTDNALLDPTQADWVQLRVSIDKQEGTVTPSWAYGTGSVPATDDPSTVFTEGEPVTIPEGSALAQAIDGSLEVNGQQSGLAAGIIATSNGGAPFQADFDDLRIATTEREPDNAVTTDDPDLSDDGTAGLDRVVYEGDQDVTVPNDIEILSLDGNDNDIAVTGGDAGTTFEAGPGATTFTGGGGADTITGTGEELDGDEITDFEDDDTLLVEDVDADAGLASVTAGSAVLGLDTTGDGSADSEVTLTGEPFTDGAAPEDFDVAVADGEMAITYDPGPGEVVTAINAGGDALEQDGISYQADEFSTGGETYTDGSGGNGEQPVYDGTVYETERYGEFSYQIPNLDAGTDYVVELHFAEIFLTEDDTPRIFDVSVEGETVREDLNILEETGDPDVAYKITTDAVSVGENGTLDVSLGQPDSDNPKISAIVVREAGGTPPPADTTGPTVESISVSPPQAGDASAAVTVEYSDPSGVAMSSIGANDIAVSGPGDTGPVTVADSTASDDGTTLTVTYEVDNPDGGAWTDGSYSVEVLAGAVSDEAPAGNVNAAASQDFSVETTTPEPEPGQSEFVVGINAGGTEYVRAGDGAVFEADEAGDPHPFYVSGQDGDNAYSDTANPIEGTTDDPLYQTERYGDAGEIGDDDTGVFSYELKNPDNSDLADGTYEVVLHYAEIFDQPQQGNGLSGPGGREFDITINRETISNYDIWEEAGGGSTATQVSRTVEVTDGSVDVSFAEGDAENPKINAIELRRVNETPDEIGAVSLGITPDADDVQASNFGAGSFILENIGDKEVERVSLDVSGALYPDSVFDPFGIAGDDVGKELTINSAGGTGVEAPTTDSATTFDSDTATYVGAGGEDGFEGVILRFDDETDGGFEPGETVTFAADMDPNSIAGTDKEPLDSGSDPMWDIGGISGAELIGSEFTVTFADGTEATGQVHGTDTQAGSEGVATQVPQAKSVDLTVNGVEPGAAGEYGDDGVSIVVQGEAGTTARVVLSTGMIQPQENNLSGDSADQLGDQLAELQNAVFPANNAARFQTVDVELDGTPQDISEMFDIYDVPDYDIPGEGELPLALSAAVIDPENGDQVQGPVTEPVYLTHAEAPQEGAYRPNDDGDIVFEVEDAGASDQGGWSYVTENQPDGHEDFTGSGYYRWTGGDNFNDPGNSTLSYEFTPTEDGTYYVNLRGSRFEEDDPTESNDSFTRILQDGTPLQALDGYQGGQQHEPEYTGDASEGWLKTYQSGGSETDWLWANKNVDDVGIPVAYDLEAGTTYTFEMSGRSEGHEVDRVHIAKIDDPADPSAGETTNPVSPDENAPLSPQTPVEDTEAPTATIEEIAPVSTLADSQTVSVVYSDDVALDAASIGADDVTVTGPEGTVYNAVSVETTDLGNGDIAADYLFEAPAGGFPAGDYDVDLPAGAVTDAQTKPVAAASDSFTVAEPADDAAARIEVLTGSGIDSSSFSGNAFTITNESGSGQQIETVTLDLSSALLPDMVFDPEGNAGDTAGKAFTPDSGAAEVGLVTSGGAEGVPPFGAPTGNDGYETLQTTFDDFDTGESFGFSVDVDPASIEGGATTGFAGSVSGLELAGSEVTVTFSDGTTQTGELFADNTGTEGEPSQGGSEAVVGSAPLSAAPSISVPGRTADRDTDAEADTAIVPETEQVVQIDGGEALAGQTVRVLVVEGSVGTDGVEPPEQVFDALGEFGANMAETVTAYDVQLDAEGQGSVEVSLADSDDSDPSVGRNYVTAAAIDAGGEVTGLTAEPLALKVGEPENRAPEVDGDASDLSVTGDEDSPIAGTVVASDPDGDDLAYAVADGGAPENGSVAFGEDGSFTYTGDADFNGDDSFTVAVSDGEGGSDTAEVDVTVDAVNDDPVVDEAASDLSVSGDEDTAIGGDIVASDVDGDDLAYTLAGGGAPQNGSVEFGEDGSFTYTGDTDFNGEDGFTVAVNDGDGGSDTVDVDVTVDAVDDEPSNVDPVIDEAASDLSVSGDEDTAIGGDIVASDVDGEDLTYTVADGGSPENGAVTFADGTFTYTGDADFNGDDSFTVAVTDGEGGSDTAEVDVTVDAVNDPAQIGGDTSGSVTEDEAEVATGTLTVSDVDDPDTFTERSASQTSRSGFGTWTVTSGGAWSYMLDGSEPAVDALDEGDTLSDSFIVESVDGTEQTVSIEIEGVTDDEEPDRVLIGDDGDDELQGSSRNNRIEGSEGEDTLDGLGGNDGILGGPGDDVLSGGDGDDDLSSGAGNDTATGGAGDDSIGGGFGADSLSGNAGDDMIGGGLGDDTIDGGDGDDRMGGGDGDDKITGGPGDDTIGGSFGNDTIHGNGGDDSLGGGSGMDRLAGGDGDDSLGGGFGNDVVVGNAGDDFLAGGGRDDTIVGAHGSDRINGGEGSDFLTGGPGSDTFVWQDGPAGDTDVVTDFEVGEDTMLLVGVDNAPGTGLAGKVDALSIENVSDITFNGQQYSGAELEYQGQTIQLIGVSVSELGLDDFDFV